MNEKKTKEEKKERIRKGGKEQKYMITIWN